MTITFGSLSTNKGRLINYGSRGSKKWGEICPVYFAIPPIARILVVKFCDPPMDSLDPRAPIVNESPLISVLSELTFGSVSTNNECAL